MRLRLYGIVVDPVGLLCPFTMVSFGADYRPRLDDIPELQILLTYGHFPPHNSPLNQYRHSLG